MNDETKKPRRQPVETARPKTRAHVIHPVARGDAAAMERAQARLEEAVGLAAAIDLTVLGKEVVRISKLVPATYIGKGAVTSIAEAVKANEVGLVVFDCAISPTQQRNLEKAWSCKVIDRTALILEIFGERARTSEGRLQVELAALTYQRSRLVRSWTHLERQRGGFGFLGGPGESQIELDRRRIDDRIIRIRRDLDSVKRTRGLHRAARDRVPYPVIALVGYTNAGKSTLFNRLSGAAVAAQDRLFATLDPTMRRLTLPSGRPAMVSSRSARPRPVARGFMRTQRSRPPKSSFSSHRRTIGRVAALRSGGTASSRSRMRPSAGNVSALAIIFSLPPGTKWSERRRRFTRARPRPACASWPGGGRA